MWAKLLEFIKKVLALAGNMERTQVEVKELRTDVTRLTHIVQELHHQIDLLKQAREHDREIFNLKLEGRIIDVPLLQDKQKPEKTYQSRKSTAKKSRKNRAAKK